MTRLQKYRCACLIIASMYLILPGCGGGQPVAPVEGKVTYKGVPLKFGSVTFQPEVGPRALGLIQPDGTFRLSTHGDSDGAIVGTHRVRIVCAEHQNPELQKTAEAAEGMCSRSLIPEKYTFPETSGFEVEVREHNEPFAFDLTD